MRRFILATGILAAATAVGASITARQSARLADAARVVQDTRDSIPAASWSRANCVAVVPNLKTSAFIAGTEHGGVISCRAGDRWSAPMFVQLAKGSWRPPAGAPNIDAALFLMNEQGVQKLLQNRMTLAAETQSYSRANGSFAPIDLSGSVLGPDQAANAAVYGSRATPKTILATREISAPTEAQGLLSALNVHGVAPVSAAPAPSPAGRQGVAARSATAPTTDDDLRARVVDIQQLLDRLLADTTPSPVGTSGDAAPRANTVTVDRTRLLQMREQLDALLAALNRR